MTSPTATEQVALTGARRFGVLIALCLATLVLGLDTTVLNVALPTLASDLDASTSQLQWMANSYNLVLAALLLPAGLLGDRYGRRKIMAIALTLFGAASLACALSDSAGTLIASRAALGIGAAMIVPVALSLITVLFRTKEERKKAIGFFVVANSIGMPLGADRRRPAAGPRGPAVDLLYERADRVDRRSCCEPAHPRVAQRRSAEH